MENGYSTRCSGSALEGWGDLLRRLRMRITGVIIGLLGVI